jgi:hypothetical protein
MSLHWKSPLQREAGFSEDISILLSTLSRQSLITQFERLAISTSTSDGIKASTFKELAFSRSRLSQMLSSTSINFELTKERNEMLESAICISINPVAHYWAQKRLAPEVQCSVAGLALHALSLTTLSHTCLKSMTASPENLLPHIKAYIQWVAAVDRRTPDIEWSSLGNVCRNQGFFDSAEIFYKTSLKRVEVGPDSRERMYKDTELRIKLGSVYVYQNRLQDTEVEYEKAMKEVERLNLLLVRTETEAQRFRLVELKISTGLASLYRLQSRPGKAKGQYYAALPLFEKV